VSKILITGGAGFFGRHLTKALLNKYSDAEIRILARHEKDIVETLVNCSDDRLQPIIGDIRDNDTLKYAVKGVNTVIHLAAMKHIDFCELYPTEAVTINTIATINLLKLFKGNTFIGMSTDKAIETTGCYGATKLLLEKLILEQAKRNSHRRYMVVRSGNIFGSSGSVMEKWKQQINRGNKITVTHPEMTRFFIHIDTLVDYFVEIIEQGKSGKIYIPFQKVIILEDLARIAVDLYGNKQTEIEITKLRKGEKMHEKLFLHLETDIISDLKTESSQNGERMSLEEIRGWLKSCQ